MKNLKILYIFLTTVLLLTGCVGMQPQPEDPAKGQILAKYPIGLHVEKIGVDRAGWTHVDMTVKNNSGKFINSVYIEVYPYQGENRVGMQNHIFNSVNVGETMIVRKQIDTSGRAWNEFRFSYKIH